METVEKTETSKTASIHVNPSTSSSSSCELRGSNSSGKHICSKESAVQPSTFTFGVPPFPRESSETTAFTSTNNAPAVLFGEAAEIKDSSASNFGGNSPKTDSVLSISCGVPKLNSSLAISSIFTETSQKTDISQSVPISEGTTQKDDSAPNLNKPAPNSNTAKNTFERLPQKSETKTVDKPETSKTASMNVNPSTSFEKFQFGSSSCCGLRGCPSALPKGSNETTAFKSVFTSINNAASVFSRAAETADFPVSKCRENLRKTDFCTFGIASQMESSADISSISRETFQKTDTSQSSLIFGGTSHETDSVLFDELTQKVDAAKNNFRGLPPKCQIETVENSETSKTASIPIPSTTKSVFCCSSVTEKNDSIHSEFQFGSPHKYEFNFSGVRPRSPTKTPKSPQSPETPSHVEDKENESFNADNINFQPVIPLKPKVDVEKSVKNEKLLFSKQVKFFKFHAGEWKEHCIGKIKIFYHEALKKVRLLIRNQVLKVCLNHFITKDTVFEKRYSKILSWAATEFSENEPLNNIFAVKFKTNEFADQFKTAIDNALNLIDKPSSITETYSSIPMKPAAFTFSSNQNAFSKQKFHTATTVSETSAKTAANHVDKSTTLFQEVESTLTSLFKEKNHTGFDDLAKSDFPGYSSTQKTGFEGVGKSLFPNYINSTDANKVKFSLILRREEVQSIPWYRRSGDAEVVPISTREMSVCWDALDYSYGHADASQFAGLFKNGALFQQFKQKLNELKDILKKAESKSSAPAPSAEIILDDDDIDINNDDDIEIINNDDIKIIHDDDDNIDNNDDNNNNDQDGIEIVHEVTASTEEIALAKQYQLPPTFYLYKHKTHPECVECIDFIPLPKGSDEEAGSNADEENSKVDEDHSRIDEGGSDLDKSNEPFKKHEPSDKGLRTPSPPVPFHKCLQGPQAPSSSVPFEHYPKRGPYTPPGIPPGSDYSDSDEENYKVDENHFKMDEGGSDLDKVNEPYKNHDPCGKGLQTPFPPVSFGKGLPSPPSSLPFEHDTRKTSYTPPDLSPDSDGRSKGSSKNKNIDTKEKKQEHKKRCLEDCSNEINSNTKKRSKKVEDRIGDVG